MRISPSSSYPRGLLPVRPLRPVPAAAGGTRQGGEQPSRAAAEGSPAALVRAAPRPLQEPPRLAATPNGGSRYSRSAIQAYRALEQSEQRRRLSQLLGIDEYA